MGAPISTGAQAGLAFEPRPAQQLTAWRPDLWAIAPGWNATVQEFLRSPSGCRLAAFIEDRLHRGAVVYPPEPLRALALTPPEAVKVVILGQDPYHGVGQAEGLAFSVAPGVKLPPSLRNIFKERQRDLGLPMPVDGSLLAWTAQGILLLNTSLTVEDGQAASHANKGWEVLTDALITRVASQPGPRVYLLWGAHAQAKAGLIREAAALGGPALILQANHPSPLSAQRPPVPFIGCGHFSAARDWLAGHGQRVDF